jgi:hypothetical protein
MLGTLILSVLAGLATRQVEPWFRRRLADALPPGLRPGPEDLRVATFALMLLGAAVLVALAGWDGSAFMAALGGFVGFFGQRIVAFVRDPDAALEDPEHDWDGAVPGEAARIDPFDAETRRTLDAVSDAAGPEARQTGERDDPR